MIGRYWSNTILVRATPTSEGVVVKLLFFDGGFGDQASTEGELTTRYYVTKDNKAESLRTAIDLVLKDAQKLGISCENMDLLFDTTTKSREKRTWFKTVQDEREKRGWHEPAVLEEQTEHLYREKGKP